MSDENKNLIPDKYEAPLGALLTVAGVVLTSLLGAGVGAKWVPYVLGALTTLGGVFKIGMLGGSKK